MKTFFRRLSAYDLCVRNRHKARPKPSNWREYWHRKERSARSSLQESNRRRTNSTCLLNCSATKVC